jgi:hypothetical protein
MLRMANETKNEDGTAVLADREAGGAAIDGGGTPHGGKRPYSPPQLKSLGKVAELTFGGAGTHKELKLPHTG